MAPLSREKLPSWLFVAAIGAEQRPQPTDGAQVSHACRGLRQAERFRDILVCKLLEVAHEDHLPILRVKLFQGGLKPNLQLMANRRRPRREPLRLELCQELYGRSVSKRSLGPWFLSIHAPGLGQAMLSVGIHDMVPPERPQP